MDRERSRDVCAAEILGENYRTTSEKFYLGFEDKEASKLERYYGIGSERCEQVVSIEFEVKHFYFDLLHDSLNNLADDSLAKLLPTADDLKQQIRLQRIPLTLFAKDHRPEWLHRRSYSRYGFLVGMSGDQVMYATQASGIVFIVDRERSRDVCAAEILGENYRTTSEKFYLGFEDKEASKLERYYGIGSERCEQVVSIEFEVKHFYFDLLHDSLNNLADDSLAKLLPTADDLKQQIRLQRIPLTLFAKDHRPEWLHRRSYSRYGFLVGMSGDQVMYATQASGIVFIVDRERSRDVCAAEILGENYRTTSEKFYLGFEDKEASKLERYYGIGSERCEQVVSIEFEVKHFYFDLLHDSLNNLADDSLAKLLPTADDLKQQIRLQRIPLTLFAKDHRPEWLHRRSYSRYGFLVGMSGDQVMYATQASGIVFIVDRERSRDVCAAEILGENYRTTSEKFYLGFEDKEASKLERYYGIGSERCEQVVSIEFEVKHFYFDLLHDSLNNLADDSLAKLLPTADDLKQQIRLQRIPLTLFAKDHRPEWLHRRSYSRYGFLVGMSGDQVMYATQASGIVFIVDRERSRDVCAAEILGENYRTTSEKFYLGFEDKEASKLERYYGIGSERCEQVVSIEFEVKHFYFDLLHDSLNNLADDSLAKLLPTADDLKQQIRLQRIPLTLFAKDHQQ